MATIKIDIDDNILEEAEETLSSIGMDIQIAVNVFLRRVAIENGLPMSMIAASSKQDNYVSKIDGELSYSEKMNTTTRTNKSITKDMVDEIWLAFNKYRKGLAEINRLSHEVSERTGMNQGSAFIYLNILSNLIKGEPNTRTMKMKDLEYFMEKIKSDLGGYVHLLAIHSLRLSVPYWHAKLNSTFADKVVAYCDLQYSGFTEKDIDDIDIDIDYIDDIDEILGT